MPTEPKQIFQLAELFIPELKELVAVKNFREIKSVLSTLSLADLADVWYKFEPREQIILFRLLSGRNAGILFQELELDEQEFLLNNLGNQELEGLLDDFDPEEAARLFHELPPKIVKRLRALLEAEQQRSVDQIFKFPDNSVGSWMKIQHAQLAPTMTTEQAIQRIRAATKLRKGLGPDGYYITDKNGRVSGFVSLRRLIAAAPKMKIGDYMTLVQFLKLDPYQDQEEAAHFFKKYKLSMVPVVDKDHKYLGYIQAEDIIPLVEEETTEDILKMAGTQAEEYETPSIWRSTRIRFPWLIATCFGQLLVAFIIEKFNFVLSEFIALASFMPFIMAMGGNVGAQSSTVLVRGLALRDYDFSDRWEVFWKEAATGLILGSTYGFVVGAVAGLIYGPVLGWSFAMVIAISTLAAMASAAVMGVVWPLTLVRFGVDPATATGPLITTTTDIVGTLVYFSLALWLLL